MAEEYDVKEDQEEAGAGGDESVMQLEELKARLAQLEQEKQQMEQHSEKTKADFEGTPAPADGTEPAAETAQADGEAGGDGEGEAIDSAADEVDKRSVYVGNVDYEVTPEELQEHFKGCGVVQRVTILTDKMGNPKGFAYIEFTMQDAAVSAVLMNASTLHGRELKVSPKRRNVPGMKADRGRGRGRGRGRSGYPGGYYDPYAAAPRGRGRGRGGYFDPWAGGYGYVPRGRGRGRGYYSPY